MHQINAHVLYGVKHNEEIERDATRYRVLMLASLAMYPFWALDTRVWHHLFISVHPIDIY